MKILVVDNEQTIRRALSFTLRKTGHRVVEAENPVIALPESIMRDVDLLIVDFDMPVMSGMEFLQTIQNRGQIVPTVILTSQQTETLPALSVSTGSVKMISKDLPLQKIMQEIESFINQLG